MIAGTAEGFVVAVLEPREGRLEIYDLDDGGLRAREDLGSGWHLPAWADGDTLVASGPPDSSFAVRIASEAWATVSWPPGSSIYGDIAAARSARLVTVAAATDAGIAYTVPGPDGAPAWSLVDDFGGYPYAHADATSAGAFYLAIDFADISRRPIRYHGTCL